MKKNAFTLIEVMMALVVVSIMLAVLAPVIATPPKKDLPQVQVMDSTPVGVIVAWYGSNHPKGWLSVDGQSITDAKYSKLRDTLGLDNLPNLNGGAASPTGLYWIIKAE